LFDAPRYVAALRAWLGEVYQVHLWSYPPLAFPLAEVLAAFPYIAALALWTGAGAVGLVLAGRFSGLPLGWSLGLAFAPASAMCIYTGQNEMFSGALILFAVAAGACALALRRGGMGGACR
jgi:hypothetical protein